MRPTSSPRHWGQEQAEEEQLEWETSKPRDAEGLILTSAETERGQSADAKDAEVERQENEEEADEKEKTDEETKENNESTVEEE